MDVYDDLIEAYGVEAAPHIEAMMSLDPAMRHNYPDAFSGDLRDVLVAWVKDTDDSDGV